MKTFVPLAKPVRSDRVAVVSPSAGLPGLFPWVQDLGLQRLRDVFGLEPVEYPTTRQMNASYSDRARDLHAAFADPGIKAVLTSIGGYDEIGLIKHLDPEVFRANPKPFFGYSDNTHLHNFLWGLGIPSFYGTAVMTQLAMQVEMHPQTVRSLENAMFSTGEHAIEVATDYNDVELDWADPVNLNRPRVMEPNDGLYWDNPADAQGPLWGGCCEALFGLMATGHHLPADEDLDGVVFYMETSEIVPDPFLVGYLLTAFGERGWLDRFAAILIARPKVWTLTNPVDAAAKAAYRQAQRDAIVQAVRAYNQHIPIVLNLDFGHTDPQLVVPSGGLARIEAASREVFFTY